MSKFNPYSSLLSSPFPLIYIYPPLQSSLRCCGAESFTDWEDSPWVLAQEKAKVRMRRKSRKTNILVLSETKNEKKK